MRAACLSIICLLTSFTPAFENSAACAGRGAVSAFGGDASDVSRLTANTALAEGGQFVFTQAERESGGSYWYGAAALPVVQYGAFGIFARGADSKYLAMDNDGRPAGFSGAFGLSFARYFPEYFFGLGLHAAFSAGNVYGDDEVFTAAGFDLRADPADFLSARAYYLNAGMPLRTDRTFFEERLADRYGAILNFHPLSGVSDFWGLDLGIGAQKTEGGPVVAGIGAEASVAGRFFLRAGYDYGIGEGADGVGGFGAGAGFTVGGAGIDGAYRFGSGGGWTISLRLQIEALKKRDFDGNHALARKYYDERRFDRAIRYSERALEIDTGNWNARALLGKSKSELDRANRREIAIIYGGNSRGQVIPYPPSEDALGGLGRYAAAIASLRRSYPANFSIDVGNMVNAGSDEHRVKLALNFYNHMSFDAIAPGGDEFTLGLAVFEDRQRRALPVVASGMSFPEESGVSNGTLLSRGGYNVFLINVLCESATGGQGRAAVNTAPADAGDSGEKIQANSAAGGSDIGSLRSLLASHRAAGAHVRAAVVHGNMDEIKKVAAELPELNLIIAGSLEEKIDTPLKTGNALVVSAGAGNKFTGCLSLRFDGGNKPSHVKNRLYPLYQEIIPDSTVENMVRLVSARMVVDKTGGYAAAPVSGVIPFISDRGGRKRAYVKTAENRWEYPLGEDQNDCRRPVFSTAGNRAAFIHGKPENMNGKLRMVDLATMNGRDVSSGKNVLEAAFSPPDGFLYYMEADSGSETGAVYKTRMYMQDAVAVLEWSGAARRDLAISDDGETILFCSEYNGKWHIYAMDSSAAAPPARLTNIKAGHSRPRMSPDGKRIAYLSDHNTFGERTDLWVFERNGAEHRRITVNSNVRDFSWKDDSRTIYFSSGVNMTCIGSIDVLDEEAGIKKVVPGETKNWSESTPRFIRYKGAPKVVYTREYADGKRQLHWVDTKDRIDEKIFASGDWNEWME